mgnify:CR=1 FL=1
MRGRALRFKRLSFSCGLSRNLALKAGLCLGVLVLSLSNTPPVKSQELQFDLEAGDATEVLLKFAKQAGVQIVVPSERLKGIKVPKIKEEMEVLAALEKLLTGSGLEIASFEGKVILLRPQVAESVQTETYSDNPEALFRGRSQQRSVGKAGRIQNERLIGSIIVSGTRIVRNGYEAPTTTTVLSLETIDNAAPINTADVVNIMPPLAGSSTPRTGNLGASGGQAGTNALNLRGLGANRTLVLLNGRRVAPQTLSGVVDINQLPNALIERVDIVTGGASAVYGSDAVAGVANFVLDKDFKGVKGEALGGVTTYGDDQQYKISLTGGTDFASGRGQVFLSGEHSHVDGISGNPRPWYRGWKSLNNPGYAPGNGQPQFIVRPNVNISTAAPGLLITSGPLRGTVFGHGGVVRQFQYGAIVSDPLMVGGEPNDITMATDLDARVVRQSVFARSDFDIADSFKVFAEYGYAFSTTETTTAKHFNLGDITIQRDNAFLPAEIRGLMEDLDLSSFEGGSTNQDLDNITTRSRRSVTRYTFGGSGSFNTFDTHWNWDAYAQKGIAKVYNKVFAYIRDNYHNAIDSVVGPSGDIVCRVALTNSERDCVPYNVIGTGVVSQEAIDYVMGVSRLNQRLTQDVVAGSVRGEPFGTWAGPVSVVLGAEYRREGVTSVANPIAEANGFFAANFKATNGSYDVTEGFLETVIPLANDADTLGALDLSSAVRLTDYSAAGTVATWKVGAVYAPSSEVKFRATRSRDIRAPNLNELFLAGQVNTQSVVDPERNNETVVILRPLIGNTALKPEKSDTLGVGVVYQPSWARELALSVDYYDIEIKDAIAVINQQPIVDRCFAGDLTLCGAIERDQTGSISSVTVKPLNLLKERARGFDLEASYQLNLSDIARNWKGDLLFRVLANHTITRTIDDGVTVTETAGDNSGSIAKWRYVGAVSYVRDPVSLTLVGRGLSGGVLDTSYIQCATNCPTSSTEARTIDNNQVAGAFYADLTFRYHLLGFDSARKAELFFKVDNALNRSPAVVAGENSLSFLQNGANPFLYDTVGRTFRGGVRFEM